MLRNGTSNVKAYRGGNTPLPEKLFLYEGVMAIQAPVMSVIVRRGKPRV